MRTLTASAVLGLSFLVALPTFADKKIEGSTVLKDLQPAGVKDKEHKHQTYDLLFDAEGKSYTCRTDSDKSVNATNFVVGAQIHYEIDGDETKIKTPQGKKLECKVVRVAVAPA